MRTDALSLSERLYRWLKLHPDQWFNGGELERMALEAGYKARNASRRLRELAEPDRSGNPPRIERTERQGANGGPHTVWYRWVDDVVPYEPKTEWDARSIAWYKKNRPKDLAAHVEMLRLYDALPVKVIPKTYRA